MVRKIYKRSRAVARRKMPELVLPQNRPNRVIQLGRAAPYVAAAARGVYNAYQLNRVVQAANRAVESANRGVRKRKFEKKFPKKVAASGGTIGPMGDMTDKIVKSVVLNRYLKPIDRRTLKLGFNYRILRWQRCNVMNASTTALPGANVLFHSTVETDKTATPCYLMCLNHTNNQGSLTTGPMYYLRFNNTGQVDLQNMNCQAADGTTTQAKWITDYTAPAFNSGGNDPELRYIMTSWYDIRLNCYGANAQPTVYDIMIVSLTDDYLDPLEIPSSTQEIADRHAVWQSLVQPFMTNPILPVQYPRKKFVIHARTKFTLQPTLNIENDTTPQSKIVHLRVRDGTINDYCYHGDGFGGAGADDKLSTTQFVAQGVTGSTDYSDLPRAKARKWLVIRALNTTRITFGSETRADTPSFDIVVRKGEYCQAR